MNNNEIQKELSRLTKRYADVGATEEKVLELFEAMKIRFAGRGDEAAMLGVRMSLGEYFHREEIFSLDDVCCMVARPKEEVIAHIIAMGPEVMRRHIVTVEPSPYLVEYLKRKHEREKRQDGHQ